MSVSLYISGSIHHRTITFGTQVKNDDIFRCFSFLKKKFTIVNIKILTFSSKLLLFKFINKCQTEIMRCTPPSSHVCDFFCFSFVAFFKNLNAKEHIKTLWLFSMDGVQLSQVYRATTRRQFIFYH